MTPSVITYQFMTQMISPMPQGGSSSLNSFQLSLNTTTPNNDDTNWTIAI